MGTISVVVSSRELKHHTEKRRIGQIPHDENGELFMMKMRKTHDETGQFHGSSALLV
jgi:hypothetical protein